MTVVVIIGILATLAVPQIIDRLRDRRAAQAAQEIALVYRNARLRAMGQGFAVMVSYNSASGFQIREALPFGGATGNCTLEMPFTCTTNAWAVAGTDYRVVGGFDSSSYSGITEVVTLTDTGNGNGGGVESTLDVCFSPRGRTFARTAAASPFVPSTGMVDVAVTRTANGRTRNVSILPNGMARLSL